MADLQISALPALGEAGIQATDVLALADLSATETKKVTVKDLVAAAVALLDSGDIPAAKVATPFAANAVATATIQDLAVTAAKIANGTITATQITDATITAAKLVNDTITATQIAANAITASELADNAVDTDAIAANAVTTAKITDANVTYAKLSLSDGDIPGSKLASASVTATQLAANSVTATELADNAVDTAAVANAAITGTKIASTTIAAGNIVNNTITATQIANGAIGTTQIADGAVTAAKLDGTLEAGSISDGAVTTVKLANDAVDSTKLAANAVDAAALADNAVDSGAIASNAVIEAKIASNAVTVTKIADGTITPAKLNTSNLDRSLNVASGNLGINNTITAATRSGITYNAQGLITGTVALAAGDLPVATTSAVGGVSVSTGLTVNGAGALSLANSVTGATVSGITFNNQGMITAATALVAGDLPVSTTSAKGAVQITSGGGLTVDGSGNLSTSTSGISAGTYQSITVNDKGVATAGAALTAALIPDLAATKITSGSFDSARIANDSIDGSKLSNTSTAIFQSIAQSGYPTAQFSGQILFDTVSEDAFIWDGNAWQAITTLTKGSLVFGGTYNAGTSQMVATTSAGIAAGLSVGSNLPTASSTTDGVYVVVSSSGTPSSPAPAIAFAPPDYILGVTNSAGSSWNEVDLSQTVAGQVASNITFTPYGQISSTNVQDALQELETEKLALSGGTITGQVLIGNTGSLVFEGSTIDAYETTITVADPTSSDKTITFPDTTGTVITSGDSGTVNSTMIANDTIQNVDIKSDAAIAYSKLASVASGYILVGNGASTSVAAAVAVTGDIGINNAGLTSITAGAIVNADINSNAEISGSKIVQGTTSVLGVLQLTDAADSASTTTAATPAAVKIAKDAADAAQTTADAALPTTGGVLTGHLTLDDEKELRFREEDAGGDHYIALKAAAALAADVTLTLPAVAPTAGQVLKANASTPTTLEWGTDSATDSSKMPLTGGVFNGDVTFTGDSSNGLWDKSASAFVADLTGTASIATSITVADESSDTTCFPLFATAATGNLGAKSGSNLTFNSSSGALTATSFVGALTGDVTGTIQTAAQANITSLGTLTGLTSTGNIDIDSDSTKLRLGADQDLEVFSDGSDNFIKNAVSGRNLKITHSDDSVSATFYNTSVALNYSGNTKFETTNTGATITGTLVSDGLTVDGDVTLTGAANNVVWDKSDNALEFADNAKATFGTDADAKIYHNDADLYIDNDTGGTWIGLDSGATFGVGTGPAASPQAIKAVIGAQVELMHNGSTKLETFADGITVKNDNNTNAQIQLFADNGDDDADKWRIEAETGGNFEIANYSTGNWVNSLVIDSAGKVGIGTTSQGGFDKFVVNGTGNVIAAEAASGAVGIGLFENGTGRFYLKSLNGSDGLAFVDADNSSERMRIDSSGRLLLGTTTAGAGNADEFTISYNNTGVSGGDQGRCGMTIRSGSNTSSVAQSGYIYFADGTSGDGQYKGILRYNHNDDSFIFSSNATTALTLDSSQNATFEGGAGIGTAAIAGTVQLDVVGAIGGVRAKVTTNNGGYKLFEGLNSSGTSVFSVTHNGTVSDSKGNLRDIPLNDQSSSATYNAALSDAGKAIHAHSTTQTVVIDGTLAWTAGMAITIINSDSTELAINATNSMSLRNSATATAGNKKLAQYGMATILFTGTTTGYISGAGLTDA